MNLVELLIMGRVIEMVREDFAYLPRMTDAVVQLCISDTFHEAMGDLDSEGMFIDRAEKRHRFVCERYGTTPLRVEVITRER